MEGELVRLSCGHRLADWPPFTPLGVRGQGCFSAFSSAVSMSVGDARVTSAVTSEGEAPHALI